VTKERRVSQEIRVLQEIRETRARKVNLVQRLMCRVLKERKERKVVTEVLALKEHRVIRDKRAR